MKPLPANRPDLWSQQQRACTLKVSRAELERRLGPALVHNEADGLGPRYRWGFQCGCGLELIIDLPRQPSQTREAVMWMEHLEVEHALAHLGLSPERVLWRADMQDPLPLEGWAVVRQADADNRFDMCVLSIRTHAECLARLKEEACAYTQSYDVERRGTPPRMAPHRAPEYFVESIAS
ncbi:hypothetical protein F0U60_24125 [Archangium minus]|uniref:Uncharacterized protein n=1 Tax=Archangium minus TaxID=83450 RepID=A0ABY9WSY3_9BACT|nr:hypothetical protein F0U60_24125 [Archangium minus]